MSRIGRAPILIPQAVKVTPEGRALRVEGPKGWLSTMLPDPLSVRLQEQRLHVECPQEPARHGALQGLYRALIANMVHGVTVVFSKDLEIVGVG